MKPGGVVGQSTDQSQWPRLAGGRYPGLPYVMLTVLLLVSSACGALFSLLPASSTAYVYDIAASLYFLLLAVAVWFVGPGIPRGWGVDLGLALAGIPLAGAAIVAISPQAQVLVGLTVLVYAVCASYFLPLPQYIVLVSVWLVAYGAALAINPKLNPIYFVIIAVFTVAVTGVVGVLVSQLRAQAVTDGLTGVLNRRGLIVMSELVHADVARGHSVVSVALIDIDDFKRYNDEHGHLAGDQVLRQVAQHLRSGLRGSDVIARFGGDEFVILLRGVDPGEAEEILSRIAASGVDVRWSAGVVPWEPGQTLDSALAEADRRLYAAKHAR